MERLKFDILAIISILLYIFALLGDSYYGLISNNIMGKAMQVYLSLFGEIYNSFTFAMIFIVIGIAINKFHLQHKFKSNTYLIVIGFILFILEILILRSLNISKDNNTSIMVLVVAPTIFIFFININGKIRQDSFIKKYNKELRDYSLYIYLIHDIFIILTRRLYNILNINTFKYRNLVMFFIVTLSSIIVVKLLLYIKSKYIYQLKLKDKGV